MLLPYGGQMDHYFAASQYRSRVVSSGPSYHRNWICTANSKVLSSL